MRRDEFSFGVLTVLLLSKSQHEAESGLQDVHVSSEKEVIEVLSRKCRRM